MVTASSAWLVAAILAAASGKGGQSLADAISLIAETSGVRIHGNHEGRRQPPGPRRESRSRDVWDGLLISGAERQSSGWHLVKASCKNAITEGKEVVEGEAALTNPVVYLRVKVSEGAVCQFSFSADGKTFTPVGESFTAREGRWVGAKIGLFASTTAGAGKNGYADFAWFRFE